MTKILPKSIRTGIRLTRISFRFLADDGWQFKKANDNWRSALFCYSKNFTIAIIEFYENERNRKKEDLNIITFLEHNLSRVTPFGQHNIGRLHAGKARNHYINCSCLLPESTVSTNPIYSQQNMSENIFNVSSSIILEIHIIYCISYAPYLE